MGQVCVGSPGLCLLALPDAGSGRDGGGGNGGLEDAGRSEDGGVGVDGGTSDGGSPRSGETCQTAVSVGAGHYGGQTTVGFANDYTGGTDLNHCTRSDRGRDRVYSVVVPPGLRLRASVTPDGALDGGAFDPSIYLIKGPADRCDRLRLDCLGADDSGLALGTNVVWYHNRSGGDELVFIVVDAYDSSDRGGSFSIDVALEAAPAGSECETAPLVGAGTLAGQSTAEYGNRYSGGRSVNGCDSPSMGRDRAYAVEVPAGQQLSVTVTPSPTYNPALFLIDGPAERCDASPRVCLASTDSAGVGMPETLRWMNGTGAERSVFLIVDSATPDGSGTFDLAISLGGPPVGDTCANAQPIGVGTYPAQSTAGLANDYSGAVNHANGCTSSDKGLDRVYAVEVPAGQRLTASVAPDDAQSQYDPSITLVAGPASNCDVVPRVCLASDDFGAATQLNVVQHTNSSAVAETVFVIIDNYDANDGGGAFTLTVALEPPPSGDRCEDAPLLGAGDYPGQTTRGFTNDYVGGSSADGCTPATAGLDRVYAISVPGGERLTATVTPAADFDAALYLVAGPAGRCGVSPRACLAAANGGAAGAVERAHYVNRGGEAETVFAIVDSPSYGGGDFDLGLELGAPPSGDTCGLAEPLAAGVMADQTTDDYTHDYGAGIGCLGTTGPDRVYATEVPTGQRLTVTATPVGTFDLSLNLVLGPVSRCEDSTRVCVSGADARGPGGPETARYENRSGEAQTIFVVVGSRTAATGAFSLSTIIDAAPQPQAGDRCQSAPLVTPGTLAGETTVGFEADYALPAACTGFGTLGRDRVYRVAIPPSQALTAVVVPDGAYDPTVYLLKGPASACDAVPMECLSGADEGGRGEPETVSYLNASAVSEEVFVVVDSYGADDPGGVYSLTLSVGAP